MDNIEVSTTNYDGTSAKVVKQAKRIKFSELTSKVLQSWYKLRVKALESKIQKTNNYFEKKDRKLKKAVIKNKNLKDKISLIIDEEEDYYISGRKAEVKSIKSRAIKLKEAMFNFVKRNRENYDVNNEQEINQKNISDALVQESMNSVVQDESYNEPPVVEETIENNAEEINYTIDNNEVTQGQPLDYGEELPFNTIQETIPSTVSLEKNVDQEENKEEQNNSNENLKNKAEELFKLINKETDPINRGLMEREYQKTVAEDKKDNLSSENSSSAININDLNKYRQEFSKIMSEKEKANATNLEKQQELEKSKANLAEQKKALEQAKVLFLKAQQEIKEKISQEKEEIENINKKAMDTAKATAENDAMARNTAKQVEMANDYTKTINEMLNQLNSGTNSYDDEKQKGRGK